MSEIYHVVGLMSGTSLDGLDIAFCRFEFENQHWSFKLLAAESVPYSLDWKKRLARVERESALQYARFDVELGRYFGEKVKDFIDQNQLIPDFVSSHGHTIFHQPEIQLTTQVGSGAMLAALCQYPVVCDFRTLDVALGGQGAPLVPIGDRLLFHDYKYCLNLGGIANISFEQGIRRIAFDICPVNIVLNKLARVGLGKEYDESGMAARNGNVNKELMKKLNDLEFYQKPYPKSIGKEWVLEYVMPVIDSYEIPAQDKLCTFVHHIALQIALSLPNNTDENDTILITGGGGLNIFLTEMIASYCSPVKVQIPEDRSILDFKEAIIFAFLGVLRWRQENNCLRTVTGANTDNCGGAIYYHTK